MPRFAAAHRTEDSESAVPRLFSETPKDRRSGFEKGFGVNACQILRRLLLLTDRRLADARRGRDFPLTHPGRCHRPKRRQHTPKTRDILVMSRLAALGQKRHKGALSSHDANSRRELLTTGARLHTSKRLPRRLR